MDQKSKTGSDDDRGGQHRGSQAGAGGGGAGHNPGNFANNPERAAEAGRKGGQHSHGGGGAEHNPGNFANDPERAAEAGRKGGQHSHEHDQASVGRQFRRAYGPARALSPTRARLLSSTVKGLERRLPPLQPGPLLGD